MSFVLLLGAVAVVAAFPLLWWAVSGASSSSAVARNLTAGASSFTDYRSAVLARSAKERAVGPAVERLADRARRLTPNGMVENLERRILLAGVPEGWPLERVLAAKVVGGAAAAGLVVLWFLDAPGPGRVVLGLGGVAFGYLLADILLYNAATKRQQAIQRELADTIDQMLISVEAGLGFDAAMVRAGRSGDGPLHTELARTMQDVQAGLARSDALQGLVARTEVDDLRHFVLAVIQADRYGVAISKVLRVQAAEMRVKRRQRAEEAAMKLPVKILFPMVLFILPVIFIVLLGPAAIRIFGALG
ncbi:MAG TPA: type II secretion system F family protein [Acidimicrobiales bacterium]|nr:type II secretion system F family protein [Acidimicrobiales bacterium]